MPYSHIMDSEWEELKPFRRPFSKENEQAFDRLFCRARKWFGPEYFFEKFSLLTGSLVT
jgi:hypothetical protein